MPVQFLCTRCGQPIEVDDVHAGQTAACPYCRSMVRVPPESTYRPGEAAAARPLASVPGRELDAPSAADVPPVPGELAGAPAERWAGLPDVPGERQRRGTKFGKLSVAAAAISAGLLCGAMIYGAVSGLRAASAGQPTNLRDLESQMQEIMRSQPEAVVINAVGTCGSIIFALAGLGLGIFSLAQQRPGNWWGWAGLLGSSAMLLCFAGTLVLSMFVMNAPGGLAAG